MVVLEHMDAGVRRRLPAVVAAPASAVWAIMALLRGAGQNLRLLSLYLVEIFFDWARFEFKGQSAGPLFRPEFNFFSPNDRRKISPKWGEN